MPSDATIEDVREILQFDLPRVEYWKKRQEWYLAKPNGHWSLLGPEVQRALNEQYAKAQVQRDVTGQTADHLEGLDIAREPLQVHFFDPPRAVPPPSVKSAPPVPEPRVKPCPLASPEAVQFAKQAALHEMAMQEDERARRYPEPRIKVLESRVQKALTDAHKHTMDLAWFLDGVQTKSMKEEVAKGLAIYWQESWSTLRMNSEEHLASLTGLRNVHQWLHQMALSKQDELSKAWDERYEHILNQHDVFPDLPQPPPVTPPETTTHHSEQASSSAGPSRVSQAVPIATPSQMPPAPLFPGIAEPRSATDKTVIDTAPTGA